MSESSPVGPGAGGSQDSRAESIRAMYAVYWGNMARSMDGIWQILGPITVAGTVIAGVHGSYLPAPLGISFAMLIILWGINVTIDLNAWHRRNLFFVTKAEREVLSADDYGRLLPAAYKVPKRGWIAFYAINVIVFFVFAILVGTYGVTRLSGPDLLMPGAVVVAGLTLTALNAISQEKSAGRHFRELFGKRADGAL